LSKYSTLPVSVMPNAGLPQLGPKGAEYPLTADELAEALSGFVSEFGLGLVGGCCGTTPEHISAVADAVRQVEKAQRTPIHEPSTSSLYSAVPFEQDASILMIGERTNSNG
ncbi:homocysteine S-methyltransferase family protein, partial [Rhodococcus qingshengii]